MKYPSKVDIINAVSCPGLIKDSFFSGLLPKQNKNKTISWAGGYSIVFQIIKNSEKWAFRVWHTEIENVKEKYQKLEKYLRGKHCPYLRDFTYVEKGLFVNGAWIDTYRMQWVDGMSLNDYLDKSINNSKKIIELAEKFKTMIEYFHKNGIAHGDLQHGNIIVTNEEKIVLIDYDSIFIDTLTNPYDIIKGIPGYQHPARKNNNYLHQKVDYFSEYVIYLSLISYAEYPELWENGTEHLLFSIDDLQSPGNSSIFSKLIQSDNKAISNLAKIIFESLKFADISMLKPLEDVLENNMEKIAIQIIDKF